MVPRGQGVLYANFIRQLIITGTKSWKVIGMRFGDGHGLVTIEGFMNDAIQLCGMLQVLEITPKEDNKIYLGDDFIVEEYEASKLSSGIPSVNFDISGEFFAKPSVGYERSKVILVYRYSSGSHTSLENDTFMNDKSIAEVGGKNNVTYISSNHSIHKIRTEVKDSGIGDSVTVYNDLTSDIISAVKACVDVLTDAFDIK
jgi:hypothetical protein